MKKVKFKVPMVTVRCVSCGMTKTIPVSPLQPDGVAMCDVCMMPMATVKVST